MMRSAIVAIMIAALYGHARAQAVLHFDVISVLSSTPLGGNGCRMLNLLIATPIDHGTPDRWRATVMYVRDRLKQAGLGDIILRLDLRRGDVVKSPRVISGLAFLQDEFTARCNDGTGPVLTIAQRLLTAREIREGDTFPGTSAASTMDVRATPVATPQTERDVEAALSRVRDAIR